MTWRRSALSSGFALGKRHGLRGGRSGAGKLRDCTQYLTAMHQGDAKLFKVLISQVAKDRNINALSAKRSAYSDMPSFLSQSAICCIAAFPASCGAFNSHVDFAAEHPEVDWLSQQRLSTVLQSFAFRLRVAISGNHDDRGRPVVMP